MIALAKEIYTTGQVTAADGSTVPLNSETPAHVAEFLKQLVVETKARFTAEVGLAYGLSALAICEGLRENGGLRHTAIDPYQHTSWSGIGVQNIRRAGFTDLVRLIEAPSYLALPQLLIEETQLDFAYIDGWHTFDYTLTDFFLIDKLLRVGGVVAIDDCFFSGVHAACRYITRNRAYRVTGVSEPVPRYRSNGRRILEWIVKPSSILRRVVKSRFLHPDLDLGFGPDTRCIAFQKLAPDTRVWNAHHEF